MDKIAIPSNGNNVATHFGRCPSYTIVEIEDNEVINKKEISNPGHKPGFLPRFLKDKGVDCVITGGMGRKAKNLFDNESIKVVTGVTGSVDKALENYLNDKLEDGENICEH